MFARGYKMEGKKKKKISTLALHKKFISQQKTLSWNTKYDPRENGMRLCNTKLCSAFIIIHDYTRLVTSHT